MRQSLDDPFESPKALIKGAKEDAIEFEAKWTIYRNGARCRPIAYDDRKTGHKIVKIRVEHGPPVRLRYLASNIMNNIRHALDQSANEGAVLLGHDKRDGYFPFATDITKLNEVIKRNCRGFDPALIAYLRTFQPYGGGDDLLYGLSKLAGSNKHQVTLNINCNVKSYIVNHLVAEIRGPGDLGGEWDQKKLELHIATLTGVASRLTTRINDETRLPLHVEIGGSSAFAGHQATTLLHTLIGKIDRVVSGIEAETARIIASRS